MTTEIQRLIATVERVRILTDASESYSTLSKARGLPSTYAQAARSLKIINPDMGYGSRLSPIQEELAKKLGERMALEEHARGERERDILLSKYSAELESLRAILPSIAAKAAVEIGVVARSLAKEAEDRE